MDHSRDTGQGGLNSLIRTKIELDSLTAADGRVRG